MKVKTKADYKNSRKKTAIRAVWFTVILIASLQSGTQYYAYKFGYHSSLGVNLQGIYPFWRIIEWHYWLGEAYPLIDSQSLSIAGLVFGVLLIGMFVGITINENTARKNEKKHGSARFAEEKDIISAGLMPPKPKLWGVFGGYNKQDLTEAVVVGGWTNPKSGKFHILYHTGAEHVLTNGPTRSGKGVTLVNNTLLTWQKSVFVPDLKGELWQLTAGWRKKYANNITLKYEPASEDSISWNPLDEVRIGTKYEIADAQNLAMLIVDPRGEGLEGKDGHWKKSSHALVTGCILHVLYKRLNGDAETANMSDIDKLLAGEGIEGVSGSTEERTDAIWEDMYTYHHHAKEGKPHDLVSLAGRDMAQRQGEEKASVLSTTKAYFTLYRDPVVVKNTSTSDFSVSDLMNSEKPVSLYMVVQPTDKDRMNPLIRTLISMIIKKNTRDLKFKDGSPIRNYKHKLLMLIDEFPSYGQLDAVQEGLSFVAGYGIKCYLICQDISQLRSSERGYGDNEAITGNCHVQNAFQPTKFETAEYLSKMTGQTTEVKENISMSGKRMAFFQGQITRSYDESQRELLTADEIMRMKPAVKSGEKITEAGDMLIFVAGYPAILGTQPLYFQNKVYLARASVSAPDKSDVIVKGNKVSIDEEV